MRPSLKPMLFLGVLLLIVLFFVGFRVGKQVERFDKSYVPLPTQGPTPTALLFPTASNDHTFERTEVDGCGVSFVLPSYVKPLTRTDNEAEFMSGDTRVFLSCDQAFVQQQLNILEKDPIVTTATPTSKSSQDSSASANIAKTPQSFTTKTGVILIQRNSDRKLVLIEMSQNISQLIQETLLLD